MPIIEGAMHDKSFGKDERGLFKATINQQRVAVVPRWVAKAALEPSGELRERAESGDDAAIETCRQMLDRKSNLEKRVREARPRAFEFVLNDQPGYVYIPTWTTWVHYFEKHEKETPARCMRDELLAEGKIREDQEAPCCVRKGKPDKTTGVKLMVYECDQEMEPLKIDLMVQQRLDATTRLSFNYEYQAWGLNEAKAREWVTAQAGSPALQSDFVIFKKSADQFAPTMIQPMHPSLYRSLGDAMLRRVLTEEGQHDDKVENVLGRIYTYEQMMARWVNTPQAVGAAPGRPQTTSRDFLRSQ